MAENVRVRQGGKPLGRDSQKRITVIFVEGGEGDDMRLQSKQMHKDVKEVSNLESCRCGKRNEGPRKVPDAALTSCVGSANVCVASSELKTG